MGDEEIEYRIEYEQEEDGRWLAEVVGLPGVLAYGATTADAISRVETLALRVLADQIGHRETEPAYFNISFVPA